MRKKRERQDYVLRNLRLYSSQIISNARSIYRAFFGQDFPEVRCFVTPVGFTYGKATISLGNGQPVMELEMSGGYTVTCSFRVFGAENLRKVSKTDCQKYLPSVLALLLYLEEKGKLNLYDEFGEAWILNADATLSKAEFRFKSLRLFSWGSWLVLLINIGSVHGQLSGTVEAILSPRGESSHQTVFSKPVKSVEELKQAISELKTQLATVNL